MSDTVLPGTRVLRAKFQILSVGTKALAATQKVAGETFLRVPLICQGKVPGGKKGGRSELTSLQFLCILRSSFSGWAQGQDESSHRAFHVPMAVNPWYAKKRRKWKLFPKQFISPTSGSVIQGDHLGISFCLCPVVWPRLR